MIGLIDTGCANLNSVRFAFARLGTEVTIINQPQQLKQCSRAILPGVGHAKVAMTRLNQSGWAQAIKEYDNPLLGICLGMQLLCQSTEEGNIDTLGVIPGHLRQLTSNDLPLPHMGWNALCHISEHPILNGITDKDYVYYVHSFAHTINNATIAKTTYENDFSSIIAHQNYIGMQFHPERSAGTGATLLLNFLQWQPA